MRDEGSANRIAPSCVEGRAARIEYPQHLLSYATLAASTPLPAAACVLRFKKDGRADFIDAFCPRT